MISNIGDTLRRRAMVLAECGYGPVGYWLGMTLLSFSQFIRVHNELTGERRAARKKAEKERADNRRRKR
ncbi:MAG: hypothetical protein J6V24_06120 [Clostridia bacterium]|nr:hypothetical protein [Clostridia bacterium]